MGDGVAFVSRRRNKNDPSPNKKEVDTHVKTEILHYYPHILSQ